MENDNKPKHLLICKIIGIIGVIVAIIGFVLVFTGFGNFENNNFMIGGFMSCFGLFIGVSMLTVGFRPEITKLTTKTAKYIQEENKEDLKDIVSNTADIASDAVKTTVKAVKEGLKNTKFCKECGAEIDADSKFCSECGKKQ